MSAPECLTAAHTTTSSPMTATATSSIAPTASTYTTIRTVGALCTTMIGCSLADAPAIDLLPTGIDSFKRIAFRCSRSLGGSLREIITLNGAIAGVRLSIYHRRLAIQPTVVCSIDRLRCMPTKVGVACGGSGGALRLLGAKRSREALSR